LFDEVGAMLEERGLLMRQGTIVDATIIAGTIRNFVRRLGMIGAKELDNAATQGTSHT
jgi:hypothetical protein